MKSTLPTPVFDNRPFAEKFHEDEKNFVSIEVTFRDRDGNRKNSLLIPSNHHTFEKFLEISREFVDKELTNDVLPQAFVDKRFS